MTATEPTPLVCPQCGSVNTSVGGSGSGMCFECAHMWDPASVVALPRVPIEPFQMLPVEEVFGPPMQDAGSTPAPTDVVPVQSSPDPTAPADVPLPADFPPSWEGLRLFREAGGTISDEHWWSEIMGGPADNLDPVPPPAPEPPPEVGAVMMIAAEILAAGVTAAYTMETPGAVLTPATGYLPDDPDLLPIIEQACAVAIGMLLEEFEIDALDAAERYDVETATISTGDPTTEVAHGEGPGETT